VEKKNRWSLSECARRATPRVHCNIILYPSATQRFRRGRRGWRARRVVYLPCATHIPVTRYRPIRTYSLYTHTHTYCYIYSLCHLWNGSSAWKMVSGAPTTTGALDAVATSVRRGCRRVCVRVRLVCVQIHIYTYTYNVYICIYYVYTYIYPLYAYILGRYIYASTTVAVYTWRTDAFVHGQRATDAV